MSGHERPVDSSRQIADNLKTRNYLAPPDMKDEMWFFDDPPNVAVIANRSIVFKQDWIAYMSHDNEDGGWQFHGARSWQRQEGDAVVANLQNIVELDAAVEALSDLPLGWHAWRVAKAAPWCRAKTNI